PDAPAKTWTHWLLYNLPPTENHLSEGVLAHEVLQNGARQAVNDFGKIGYGGPAPPGHKPHRYYFTLYALDKQLKLPARATRLRQTARRLDRHAQHNRRTAADAAEHAAVPVRLGAHLTAAARHKHVVVLASPCCGDREAGAVFERRHRRQRQERLRQVGLELV